MIGSRINHCCLIHKSPPCFIQLGRFGDLILLFPAFKLVHDKTGMNPVVIVSHDYASVFDGISYATPHVISGHWFMDMPKARELADRLYGGAIIPQWWQPGVFPTDIPPGPMVLQCHGREWDCDWKKYSDFGTSMWIRAGFTREDMLSAPLVFDRRDKDREDLLFKQHVHSGKPLLLYNFTGQSSPFGYTPELMRLLSPFRNKFEMVDLGHVRAPRLYDLLGLYDRASGLITIDTSTCHLAPASNVPTIWLTVPGWGKSIPRGNVALHVQYDSVPERLNEIQSTLDSWVK